MDKAGNIGQSSVIITKRTTQDIEIPPGIPGYNIIILLGAGILITLLIFKRLRKN